MELSESPAPKSGLYWQESEVKSIVLGGTSGIYRRRKVGSIFRAGTSAAQSGAAAAAASTATIVIGTRRSCTICPPHHSAAKTHPGGTPREGLLSFLAGFHPGDRKST